MLQLLLIISVFSLSLLSPLFVRIFTSIIVLTICCSCIRSNNNHKVYLRSLQYQYQFYAQLLTNHIKKRKWSAKVATAVLLSALFPWSVLFLLQSPISKLLLASSLRSHCPRSHNSSISGSQSPILRYVATGIG